MSWYFSFLLTMHTKPWEDHKITKTDQSFYVKILLENEESKKLVKCALTSKIAEKLRVRILHTT